jgi:hypothetical protein
MVEQARTPEEALPCAGLKELVHGSGIRLGGIRPVIATGAVAPIRSWAQFASIRPSDSADTSRHCDAGIPVHLGPHTRHRARRPKVWQQPVERLHAKPLHQQASECTHSRCCGPILCRPDANACSRHRSKPDRCSRYGDTTSTARPAAKTVLHPSS